MIDDYQEPPEPTEEEEHLAKIKVMDHESVCRLWRFGPAGHIYFRSDLPYADVFKKRLFEELGGFTPEISKRLGW